LPGAGGIMSMENVLFEGSRLALLLPFLALPGYVQAQQQPIWISPTQLASSVGFVTLRWSVKGGDSVALFRVTEEHSGERQVSFTDLAEIRLHRPKPGEYTFTVQACNRLANGYARCGQASSKLTLALGRTDSTPLPDLLPPDMPISVTHSGGLPQ
jgi:hypothetical protein